LVCFTRMCGFYLGCFLTV